MGTDVFLLTKPAGSNSIQRACSQASIIMPLLAAEIPAKLNSTQLSRPTADVTEAQEAIGEQIFT
jgi:hypothetical protein